MIAKCPCDHCGENIEFATEEFLSGSSVACPHCGKETFLSVSPKPKPSASSPPKPVAPATPPPIITAPGAAYPQKSSNKFSRRIVAAILVVVIGFLAICLLDVIIPDEHPAKLSGVYALDLGFNTILTVDLRSDGSGLFCGAASTWTLEGNTINLQVHDGRQRTYKIEGDDLIDERGDRWLRER